MKIAEIPSGKIKCFITGKLRKDTPEEKVRQSIARSLVEEYGYKKENIAIEFPVKIGSKKKRVDIAVFKEGIEHKQENIYIIVEVKQENTKPSNKKEGIEQLKSYIASSLNCKFGLWIGSERIALEKVEKERILDFIEVPDIPHAGEDEPSKPTRNTLVKAVNLKQIFKRIHNYIYVNQGFQKDKAFEELLKIIFIKVFDEQWTVGNLKFYTLPNENVSEVKRRLEKVFDDVKREYEQIFKKNEKIELSDKVLKYVISELQRFSFVDTDTDIKGEAYEELVGTNLRGDRGEFFTPRSVCDMAVEIAFSLFDEQDLLTPGRIKILDPSVGTGGFLIAGINKIKKLLIEKLNLRYDQLRDRLKKIADKNFYGVDFNPFLVKAAQMNMVMHGDGYSNIVHTNSLEKSTNWSPEAREKIQLESFDLVITNPPFGSKAKIDDPEILSQYEIAHASSALPPEQLFIERDYQFLKPGGILVMVLPDNILSNPGLTSLRKWILEKMQIIASIDLPVETFEPHTGTQTSILIMRKKTQEEVKYGLNDYEIFMSLPEKVGHDRRGNPIYKMTPDGKIVLDDNGNPIIDDQLPIVAEVFKEWINEQGLKSK